MIQQTPRGALIGGQESLGKREVPSHSIVDHRELDSTMLCRPVHSTH